MGLLLQLIGEKPSLTPWDLKLCLLRKAFPVSVLKPTCCDVGSVLFLCSVLGNLMTDAVASQNLIR